MCDCDKDGAHIIAPGHGISFVRDAALRRDERTILRQAQPGESLATLRDVVWDRVDTSAQRFDRVGT